ncbi:MAG: hypothetical protein ACPHZ7_03220 [Vibrio toranzoniae]
MKYNSLARRKAARTKPKAKVEKPKAKKATPSKATNLKKTTSADGKTATYSNSNRRAQASSKVTGGVKTKAGTYKVYGKQTAAAKNFRSAFANAKKAGYKTFTWEGKKYSTKTK